MQVIRYQDPQVYQTEISNNLLQYEAENNLLLGILANFIAGEYRDHPPYLMQVTEGDITQAVVMRTPPFPVLISFSPLPLKEEVEDLVLNDLWEEFGSELTGITAEKSLSARLSNHWAQISGKSPEHKMAMRIYKLEKVQPVSDVPGKLRAARDEDRPFVFDWYSNFHRDAFGEDPEPAMVKKGATRFFESDLLQRGMMIWEVDGKPVSMAGYTGPTPNGIRIGVVYTPPEQRNKGYASACTAGLSQHLLDLGFQFCFLFTDLMNPTSNRIYQRIGYAPVCDVDEYEFK
jgi:predicted GNAT family acetyltransferase